MAVHKVAKGEKKTSHLTLVGQVKLAADTMLVVNQPLDVEDEFKLLYDVQGKETNVIIEPPFNPLQLIAICTRNNILQQCVHVMEVNVDGTGHTIEKKEEKSAEDEKEKKIAENFFEEPYPGESFVTMRRKLRVDLEQTGNGYLEVLRNVKGEVVMLRHLPTQTMRLVRLDDPVQVERILMRGGKEVSIKMWMRERRFVQAVANERVYYKEFGASRTLNRKTGMWVGTKSNGNDNGTAGTVSADDVASEVLHFTVDRDVKSPYGLPRWINNLPSVLGSRKAEEYNLEFFDAGGVPPAMILIEGGSLTTEVRRQIQAHFSGGVATNKHRVAVVEIQSASGTLDQTGKVGVKVERFGDARQNDSMFKDYGDAAEERVRTAFRLPPLFVGKSADYNFATAMTSYMVAEEQVFEPERKEFDEIINKNIMKALGIKNYRFVSNPITLKNVDVMMKALEQGKPYLDGEEYIRQLNSVAGMNMEYSEKADQRRQMQSMMGIEGKQSTGQQPKPAGQPPKAAGGQSKEGGQPQRPDAGGTTPAKGVNVNKSEYSHEDLIDLVEDWCVACGLTSANGEVLPAQEYVISKVGELNYEDRRAFERLVAMKMLYRADDPEGIDELAGASIDLMSVDTTSLH